MKRTVCTFLALFLAATALAACGKGESSAGPASTTAAESTEAPVTEAPKIKADIPSDAFYDGYEFKILTEDEVGTIRAVFEIDAEQTGAVMDDAVYARNLQLNEDLGVKVVWIPGPYAGTGWINQFKNAVSAGDNSYNVLVATQNAILAAGPEVGAELGKLPYIDIEKPWWDTFVIRNSAVANKTYGLTGSLNLTDDGSCWNLFFDKDLAKNNNIPDMYSLVKSGKWTFDKFREFCSDVTTDLNGDAVVDQKDQWGYVTSNTSGMAFLWSAGGQLSSLDKDGKFVLDMATEKNITILSKVHDLLVDRSVTILARDVKGASGSTDWDLQRGIFIEGRALFLGGVISYADVYLRNMEDDWGILPNPKYDENQKDYITTMQEWAASMWLVSRISDDLKRDSIIVEQLCYLSDGTIVPAYYDSILSLQAVRDPQDAEMLTLICDSRTTYDIGYTFQRSAFSVIANGIQSDSNTLASDIASIKDSTKATLDAFYDKVVADNQ